MGVVMQPVMYVTPVQTLLAQVTGITLSNHQTSASHDDCKTNNPPHQNREDLLPVDMG